MKKIVFGVPNEGHAPTEAYDNRMTMAFHLGVFQEKNKDRFEFYFHTVGRLLTPYARELLVDKALAIGADYIFMVDDDMIVPTDLFESLYRHDVDIVAPLAFTRNTPYFPVAYKCVEGWDSLMGQEYFQNHWVLNYPKETLFECDAVGFGAVLIKCDVLRKMKKPYFMSTCGSGEDVYFCYKAKREAGARVFMDSSVKLGHIGMPHIITEETFEEYHKNGNLQKVHGLHNGPGLKLDKDIEVGVNGAH